MNHSIVRWLTAPDTWDFTDDIKPDAENPKKNRTASSFAISIWNEDPDTWEHVYVTSNNPPALHKINLSKTNIWAGEKGLVKISFEVTDEDGEDIQYKVLINNEEVIPLTNFYPTPAQIEASIPITRFNEKENLLELIVIDELGLETYFSYIIKKENRDTFTFKRVFDFKEDYMTDGNVEVIYGEGLTVKETRQGKVDIEIPTEGKSKIKNIEVDGYGNQDRKSIIPALSSNIQDGYIVSASSKFDSRYEPFKAFDGKNEVSTDCWASSSNVPQWIQIKLPEGQIVDMYSISERKGGDHYPPKSWRFEGSFDGQNWVVLDERVDEPDWLDGETRYYEVKKAMDRYLYYRLYITEKHGNSRIVAVGEIQFYTMNLDRIEELTIEREMTYLNDLGEGKVYESRLLTEYSDINTLRLLPNIDGELYKEGKFGVTNKFIPISESNYVYFNSDNIQLHARTFAKTFIVTENPINFDYVDKIIVDWEGHEYSGPHSSYGLVIDSSQTSINQSGIFSINKTGRFSRITEEIDVSNLKGDLYLKFYASANTSWGAAYKNLFIYNVFLLDKNDNIISANFSLLISNNKYYTYQNNVFIEVEPTVENFKEKYVDSNQLIIPTNKVVLTMEETKDLEDGKIFRKSINVDKYGYIENIFIF